MVNKKRFMFGVSAFKFSKSLFLNPEWDCFQKPTLSSMDHALKVQFFASLIFLLPSLISFIISCLLSKFQARKHHCWVFLLLLDFLYRASFWCQIFNLFGSPSPTPWPSVQFYQTSYAAVNAGWHEWVFLLLPASRNATNTQDTDLLYNWLPYVLSRPFYYLIYTHCWEHMKSAGTNDSKSLLFMMKVMVTTLTRWWWCNSIWEAVMWCLFFVTEFDQNMQCFLFYYVLPLASLKAFAAIMGFPTASDTRFYWMFFWRQWVFDLHLLLNFHCMEVFGGFQSKLRM